MPCVTFMCLPGGLGIACVAMGTSWIPSLQTNLTTQYGQDTQGAVCGMLNQQKDLSMLPAYLMSLAFTFNLKRQHGVYFPGATFLLAACMGVCAIVIHYSAHGHEATTRLTLRKLNAPSLHEAEVHIATNGCDRAENDLEKGNEKGSEERGESGEVSMQDLEKVCTK
jgi:hypothetical protein